MPARALALVGLPLPVPPGRIGIYVSEPLVDLYAARPGTTFPEFYKAFSALALVQTAQSATDSVAKKALPELFVAGVWRDYARQTGAVVMAAADFERFSGDRRVNDLALWLRAGADVALVQQALMASAAQHACGNSQAARSSPDHGVAQDSERCLQAAEGLLEFASARQLRTRSMQMFERSFAVTYWLQAVAIAIGLAGVGASFSAQVLARRSEFGMLTHLGLTRRQILGVVALEGCAWTVLGALAGLLLGLGVSVLLVDVVNPQSFHWSMDLRLPWLHLLALCAAVVATGTLTAWLAGRAAVAPEAVLAVRQDW